MSKEMLGQLKYQQQFNLYDRLMVLVDTKHQKLNEPDQESITAYGEAASILIELMAMADAGKTNTERICTTLFNVLSCLFLL